MQFSINLDQNHIDSAIVNHLSTLGIDTKNKTVTVEFTAGRGVNGPSAEVTLSETNLTEPSNTPSIKPKTKVTPKAVEQEVPPVEEPKEPEVVVELESVPEDNTPKKSLFGNK